MMFLCLSYDHRAIDGSIGAQFLQEVRKYVEDPRQLLEG
jgi:pyruvate/2-oxoglutarate dehydrogenase complex dihydrolipoamide acyltransferase (E2) component